jgi:hypothetical protein
MAIKFLDSTDSSDDNITLSQFVKKHSAKKKKPAAKKKKAKRATGKKNKAVIPPPAPPTILPEHTKKTNPPTTAKENNKSTCVITRSISRAEAAPLVKKTSPKRPTRRAGKRTVVKRKPILYKVPPELHKYFSTKQCTLC